MLKAPWNVKVWRRVTKCNVQPHPCMCSSCFWIEPMKNKTIDGYIENPFDDVGSATKMVWGGWRF